jgi:hypothetical protein
MIDVIRKHAETLKILGGVAVGLIASCIWLNGKFEQINIRLTRIETVLVMRGIMPGGLAAISRPSSEKAADP